jgi:hypothetical protein
MTSSMSVAWVAGSRLPSNTVISALLAAATSCAAASIGSS